MRPVFVDASFWIVLRDSRDLQHEEARGIGRRLTAERRLLVSTTLVFAEIHAYFSRHAALRRQVLTDFWELGGIRTESPPPGDLHEALSLLRRHADKTYSFCDAVSFAVMRRLGLTQALAFDDHFRQFGEFEVLG